MKKWRLKGELQTIPEMKDGQEVNQEESSDGSYSGESYTRSAKLPRYDDILSAAIAGMNVSKSIVMSREPLIDLANAFKKFKSTGTLEQGLSALGRFISAVNADEYKDELKEMLESQALFSYPRLAASYRYGYGALRKEKFMVSRLKTPINRIYRKLFAGNLNPVEPPQL